MNNTETLERKYKCPECGKWLTALEVYPHEKQHSLLAWKTTFLKKCKEASLSPTLISNIEKAIVGDTPFSDFKVLGEELSKEIKESFDKKHLQEITYMQMKLTAIRDKLNTILGKNISFIDEYDTKYRASVDFQDEDRFVNQIKSYEKFYQSST